MILSGRDGIDSRLPNGWQAAKLGDICTLNPRRGEAGLRGDTTLTSFVPMSAVDERLGAITAMEVRPYAEVKKGYTYFAENDVLFAKITPCMQNGKHAIARGLIDGMGFGSTEFHVVRANSCVCPEWIHYFVRQPWVLTAAVAHFSGTVGQQRVPQNFLANLEIPLPPLSEQKRIVASLYEQMAAVEKARAATEAQLVAAKVLPAAYLRGVFDSPEAQKWPKKRLEQVCRVMMGQSPKGDSYNSESLGVPLLNGPTEFGEVHPVAVQWTTSPTRYAEKGDVLLCVRGATTGRMNIADQQYCIGRGLAAIRPADHNLDSTFLKFALKNITAKFLKETAGSTFPNLPGEKLKRFTIAVPSLEAQVEAATALTERLKRARTLLDSLIQQLCYLEHSPTALLDTAFAGRL